MSFDIFCLEKSKSQDRVYSRFRSDFGGYDAAYAIGQSTPFGLSVAGCTAKAMFLYVADAFAVMGKVNELLAAGK